MMAAEWLATLGPGNETDGSIGLVAGGTTGWEAHPLIKTTHKNRA